MREQREGRDRDNRDRGDRGGDERSGGGFRGGGRRGRPRPAVDLVFDYKDPDSLRPFITEHGKIIPSRVSRLSAKQQRSLKVHIKRARSLALLPVGTKYINYEEHQSGYRDRGPRGGGMGGGGYDRGHRGAE